MSGWLPPGVTDRDIDEASPGYWDDHETYHGTEDQPELYECDCCGKMVEPDCMARCWPFGIETFACEECRGVKP